jgi:hypothetical protein
VRRSLRLALLLAALGAASLLSLRSASPFSGKEDLGWGATVERVELLEPRASLLVVTVPRDSGLRLRSVLADARKQRLAPVSETAARESALAAVNGDYHRTDGFCFATTYSTLIDRGVARAAGSPFANPASFALDLEGRPRIGPLDLQARLRSATAMFPVNVNLEMGDLLLIERPPTGLWTAPGRKGVPLARDGDGFRVAGPPSSSFSGPALLARGDAASISTLATGEKLTLEYSGADAGRLSLAIGTSPRLLAAGEPTAEALATAQSGFTSRLQRTAVGFDERAVYLVTTPQEPHTGLSMGDLARAMKKIGCRDAIALDGGPSTTLWARGRSLTVEPDAHVASAILVLPPGEPGPPLR